MCQLTRHTQDWVPRVLRVIFFCLAAAGCKHCEAPPAEQAVREFLGDDDCEEHKRALAGRAGSRPDFRLDLPCAAAFADFDIRDCEREGLDGNCVVVARDDDGAAVAEFCVREFMEVDARCTESALLARRYLGAADCRERRGLIFRPDGNGPRLEEWARSGEPCREDIESVDPSDCARSRACKVKVSLRLGHDRFVCVRRDRGRATVDLRCSGSLPSADGHVRATVTGGPGSPELPPDAFRTFKFTMPDGNDGQREAVITLPRESEEASALLWGLARRRGPIDVVARIGLGNSGGVAGNERPFLKALVGLSHFETRQEGFDESAVFIPSPPGLQSASMRVTPEGVLLVHEGQGTVVLMNPESGRIDELPGPQIISYNRGSLLRTDPSRVAPGNPAQTWLVTNDVRSKALVAIGLQTGDRRVISPIPDGMIPSSYAPVATSEIEGGYLFAWFQTVADLPTGGRAPSALYVADSVTGYRRLIATFGSDDPVHVGVLAASSREVFTILGDEIVAYPMEGLAANEAPRKVQRVGLKGPGVPRQILARHRSPIFVDHRGLVVGDEVVYPLPKADSRIRQAGPEDLRIASDGETIFVADTFTQRVFAIDGERFTQDEWEFDEAVTSFAPDDLGERVTFVGSCELMRGGELHAFQGALFWDVKSDHGKTGVRGWKALPWPRDGDEP
jgi:hypothetical protein